MNRLVMIMLCAMLLFPAGGNAADSNGAGTTDSIGLLSLQLTEAAKRNETLQAAFAEWRAAMMRAPQVSSMPDPQLSFGYYIEPVETRTGPQRMRYGIRQKFPFAGKLDAKEAIALKKADALKAKADAIKLRIFRDVKTAYYELAYLEQAISITRESIALVSYMESIVRAKYTAGSVPYANVLRTQVELDKMQERLVTLEDSRRPVVARLNAAMSRPMDTPMAVVGEIPVMELDLDEEVLKDTLQQNNPQLLTFVSQEAAATAGLKLAEKSYFPDVTLGLDTIQTDEPRNSAQVMHGGNDPIIASVSINLPIWRESLDAGVQENKEKQLAARRGRLGLKDTLSADLEMALYKYRDAGRRLSLYRDTLIPKAEQVIEVTLEAFQNSGATSLELIDAEKTYFELQLASARALTEQAQLVAQMEYLVGQEIPCRYHGYIMKKVALPEEDLTTTVSPQQ